MQNSIMVFVYGRRARSIDKLKVTVQSRERPFNIDDVDALVVLFIVFLGHKLADAVRDDLLGMSITERHRDSFCFCPSEARNGTRCGKLVDWCKDIVLASKESVQECGLAAFGLAEHGQNETVGKKSFYRLVDAFGC